MKATTPGIAVLLTCVGCASTVAAQAPQDAYTRVFELRQESNSNKAQTQNEARQRANAEKAEAARQRRGGPQRGGQRGGQAEASETFTRMVHLDRGATFDLRNVVGDVTITGGGGREGKIEVFKRVRAFNDQRAQLVLPQLRVEIAERGGNVEVRTIQPRGAGEARVDYVVTLPANINVILRSSSGNLRVQNMSGDELNVNTLRGNVTVSDLQSRLLELHTVLGDMTLQNIAARRAFVQTMGGNVEYTGPLQRTGQYRIQTHTGNIRMMIPPGGPGFDLDAMTNKGDLQSDFVVKPQQQGPVVRRPAPLRFLRGPVGDAGAMLTTYSFGGNIVIVKSEGQ
jgi:putative adhesin